MAQALLQLANLSRELSDLDAADPLAREAWEHLEAMADRVGVVRALQTISSIALERGDREAARPLLEERLAISRELGDLDFRVDALGALGHLARDEGDYPRAHSYDTEEFGAAPEAGATRWRPRNRSRTWVDWPAGCSSPSAQLVSWARR